MTQPPKRFKQVGFMRERERERDERVRTLFKDEIKCYKCTNVKCKRQSLRTRPCKAEMMSKSSTSCHRLLSYPMP